jgi:hypothetical protein
MSAHSREEGGPTAEQLTAYVDGELGPSECAAVEAWLAWHPRERATVAAQRWLARLWENSAPPEPHEQGWAQVLARVAEATSPTARSRVARRRLVTVLAAAGAVLAATAATLLLVVLYGQAPETPKDPLTPWPVVASDDVEIESIDGGDLRALVVGEPPVNGPLVLASAEDVTIDDTGHDVEVVMPGLGSSGKANVPMFMAPLDREQEPGAKGQEPAPKTPE